MKSISTSISYYLFLHTKLCNEELIKMTLYYWNNFPGEVIPIGDKYNEMIGMCLGGKYHKDLDQKYGV